MEKNYLVTEDNLIGSVATAMLKLKQIRDKGAPKEKVSEFINLIKFIENANDSEYEKLLYDKNFIISAPALESLHLELNKNNISSRIDLTNLITTLSKIVSSPNIAFEDVDIATSKLKQLVEILLHIKAKNQSYM